MKSSRKVYTVNSQNQNEADFHVIKKPVRSLHTSLKWVLSLSQCFAQMPVIGVTELDFRRIRFSWWSWRTVYCILNCIGSGFMTGLYISRILRNGANLYEYNTLGFHCITLIVTFLFLKLAMEWSKLMYKWSEVEFAMRGYGWPPHLHTRITIMSVTVLTIAAVETMMTKISKAFMAQRCKRKEDDFFEYYNKVYLFAEVFSSFNYAAWKAVILLFQNVLATFAWSFNDLFVMLISTALAVRFKQITARLILLTNNSKVSNINMWRETREDYNRLSKMTRIIDEALSYITLTSFASNLFFILMQLFHSLRKMEDTLEKVYFFFSFGFLILRTICVSLYGAWIYDESREPLAILNSVSSDVYNVEIRRFIEQIKFDTIALTGKNFFYVTRGLVLSMAGAIVTYELVLIQFNENLLKESAAEVKNHTGKCIFL